ncbi:MAG: hypothetical protein J0M24_26740 [Verrucomicrobia bacterium]|nr:hypothetical protein [Verrucomicrobiota bacterium]
MASDQDVVRLNRVSGWSDRVTYSYTIWIVLSLVPYAPVVEAIIRTRGREVNRIEPEVYR